MTIPGLWDAPPHLADTQEAEDFRERMEAAEAAAESMRPGPGRSPFGWWARLIDKLSGGQLGLGARR